MDLSGRLIKGTGSYEVKEVAPPVVSGQILSNNHFLNWTADNPDDWSVTEDATNYITQDVDGGCRFVRVNSSAYMWQAGAVQDRVYKIVIKISKDAGTGDLAVTDGSTSYFSIASVGIHTHYFKSTSAFDRLYITCGNGTDMTIEWVTLEEVPEGYPLMDKGMKYLECTSAGTVAFPSDQAYGEWEFDLFKGADANQINVFPFTTNAIIASTAYDGYRLALDNAEKFEFRKFGGGTAVTLGVTAASYFSNETWHRVKFTRTKDGEWNYYIRGGIFGNNDWTLVDVSGGSGSNPVTDNTHTIAKYLLLDFDAGDRIANLTMKNLVKQ